MTTFEVTLNERQQTLFRKALEEAERRGDCRLIFRYSKPRVEFTDYEGVQATLRELMAVRTVTAADLRSWEAVKRKIDKGLVGP